MVRKGNSEGWLGESTGRVAQEVLLGGLVRRLVRGDVQVDLLGGSVRKVAFEICSGGLMRRFGYKSCFRALVRRVG